MTDEIQDPAFDLARAAQLQGRMPARSLTIRRPSTDRRWTSCDSIPIAGAALQPVENGRALHLHPVPVYYTAIFNSAYPKDRNNGALWAGRGLSTGLTAGMALEWGPISAAIAPTIAFQQNRAFAFPLATQAGYSRYSYGIRNGTIDWPYRFGPDPFWTVDPGQSYLRVDAFGAAAGVSTENLWWGPAIRHPIMMSNTAPGFRHFFLGTSRPIDIGIGHLEGEAIWGILDESGYFDSDSDNDRRRFAGVVADFQPGFFPGLYLGGARAVMTVIPPDGMSLGDFLFQPYLHVQDNPGGVAGDDQLFSLFGRWVFPASGAEFFFEWARNDHWADLEDLLAEPDYSQAYLMGFQVVRPLDDAGERSALFSAEWVHLEASITSRVPAGRHGEVYIHYGTPRNGYTNRGQLLGAAIGPSSDAQYLRFDILEPARRMGVFLQRVRYDTDAYERTWADDYAFHGHDVEVSAGLHLLQSWNRLTLDVTGSWNRRRNRNFVGLDTYSWDFLVEHDWALEASLIWRPAWHASLPVPFPGSPGAR